jgi:hypothetical protein
MVIRTTAIAHGKGLYSLDSLRTYFRCLRPFFGFQRTLFGSFSPLPFGITTPTLRQYVHKSSETDTDDTVTI